MQPLSQRPFAVLLAVLATLMIVTRFHHFGTAIHLPDASMAVFFLGGLYLRRHLAFAGFMALAVLIDWVAIEHAGVSDFCVTPAYSFLLPAYAVLWYGGRLYAPRLQSNAGSLLGLGAVALLSASLSFAISNGGFYWFGGRYAQPHFAEYVARAWQWGPLFVRTTMAYIAVAAVAHVLLGLALRSRGARQTAGT
jgi:hypothetical protein